MTESTTAEHRLISAIKSWTGERLIGDDCAVLPGGQLVTADTLVEDTHFLLPDTNLSDLGWKSMAVNISDVAAMAGRPRYAIICLTLPPEFSSAQVEALYKGFVACGNAYRCRIVGGDLTKGPALTISITIIADEHENGVMMRAGAKPGDIIAATGDFGASAAGLWMLQNGQKQPGLCLDRHCKPLPRLCESWAVIRNTAGRGAMMDASDGLADALIQIAHQSKTGIELEARDIPIAAETKQVAQLAAAPEMALQWALYGGEDYELVACLRPTDWDALSNSPDNTFHKIGMVTEEASGIMVKMMNGTQETLSLSKTFQHWNVAT